MKLLTLVIIGSIILGIGYIVIVAGVSQLEEEPKELIDLNCEELKEKYAEEPYLMIRDNELYKANVLEIMRLKDCRL